MQNEGGDSKEPRDLLSKKWFFWALFISLFAYAIMRAWSVVPMLDELATYFSYIRTGHFFNTIEHLNANNHVLNSFFGHHCYRLFGDYFFLYRLSSLLALPIYFFSIKYIVHTSFPKPIRVVVFLSLVCIPWLFEYFSYSRGYGMAIAFFFAAIAFAIKLKSINHWMYLVGFFICLWFSIASSLTYLLPSLILLVYVELLFILKRDLSKQKIFLNLLIALGWIAAIIPLVQYSFKLKEAGALWWGFQGGLWESTGESLSRLVLFTDALWVFYLVLALLLICLFTFLNSWMKSGFWSYLKQTEVMIFILFIGSLIGIVLMHYILDVNYPADRVGMYLVPLFILFISLFLSKYTILRYVLFGLCFFPLSFIFHLNLSTSIFAPEDRIPTSLTNQIKENLSDQTALSAEHVSHLSYAYSCRKDKKVHIAYSEENDVKNYGDYHISWRDSIPTKGYSTITRHPESRTWFMRRIQLIQKKVIIDTLISELDVADKFFKILKRPIDSVLRDGLIQVEISGEMEFDQPTNTFNVIQNTLNENSETVSSRSPHFNWYFSDRTDVNFVFTDRIIKLKPEETQFHFFLLNSDLNKIKIKFLRVRIYQINY